MRFTKMHGLGNDYVFVDRFAEELGGVDLRELARRVSDRHRGIGSDGLILMGPSERADLRMEIFNADGRRAQMCGNGIRCVVRYAHQRGLTDANPMRIETDAGIRVAEVGRPDGPVAPVTVVMGETDYRAAALPARFKGERIIRVEFEINGRILEVSCVSLGNPHAVVFVKDFSEIDLERDGRALETHPMFPERINVHFARVDGPGEITMRSWERGSGATQACGTGACAVAVLAETAYPARVHLPGGDLVIDSISASDAAASPYADLLALASGLQSPANRVLLMTGPAEHVFDGEWDMERTRADPPTSRTKACRDKGPAHPNR